MIVYHWKTKGLLFKQKWFFKNNLKQYSLIATADSIIFLKKNWWYKTIENNSPLF